MNEIVANGKPAEARLPCTIEEFLAWYEGVTREQLVAAAGMHTREPATA